MKNFLNSLKFCNGKYIALLEGDDYWIDENKLHDQVDFLENNPDYGLVFTNYKELIQKKNRFTRPIFKMKSGYIFEDILTLKARIPTLSIVTKKSLIDNYLIDCSELIKNIHSADFSLKLYITLLIISQKFAPAIFGFLSWLWANRL